MKYYPIDEDLARRAKEMNSFFDYVPGSTTGAYQRSVDRAVQIAEFQKQRVDPIHHEKIDRLLDAYARRLAENINRSNEIATRVPSILVAGGGNFPVRKKEKQNRAADANMEEWRQIRTLLDKIQSTGLGGISADEPDAVAKLKAKLERLEAFQEKMKAVNAYYRKGKTLDGCPLLSAGEIEKLKAEMARNWRVQPKPYESYELSNNNASIRQVKARIEELTRQAETVYEGWQFDGGEVKMNREINRLQVFFDAKPDKDTCSAMRHGGFRWAPSVGAWQRQLNDNAIRAVKGLEFLRPLGEEPAVQTEAQVEPAQAQVEPAQAPAEPGHQWGFYIIADLKTWADNAENRSLLEPFDSFEAARARFEELRGEGYNSEVTAPGPDGQPPARLTLGIESADGMSAADILHVRQGKNYLVTDFVRMERLRDDPAVMEILSQVSREIGFDFVRVHERTGDRSWTMTVVPFAEWDNPYFPAATPGSIAARYDDLLHRCYPAPRDEALRKAQVEDVIHYIQREGSRGVIQMSSVIGGLAAGCPDNAAIHELAAELTRELSHYGEQEQSAAPKQKAQRKKSRER